jgi:four helix bundle protein
MGIKSFEDLEVYQKAFDLSIEIHKASLEFPKIEQFALSSQIRRASKSICANLAEGYAKQFDSNAEYKRFILIALGSANEMLVWLSYVERLEYVSHDLVREYKDGYLVICKMLKSLHQSRSKLDT